MSVTSYSVSHVSTGDTGHHITHSNMSPHNTHHINNIRIFDDHASIPRHQIYFKDSRHNIELPFTADLMYYKAHRGNNSEFEFRASGAYIFRPDGDDAISFGPSDEETLSGPVYDELIRSYSDWVSQTIRLYHDDEDDLVEVGWRVGPIPVDDGEGKEVIVRFCSSLANDGIFFTDSNGRQMVERRLNVRPDYEINMTEPTAQNYYPVNSKILIHDSTNQMAVLTDRSQAGSSLTDGCVELMVHRRLLDDDAFGVGEALNEVAYGQGLVAVGKHMVIIDNDEENFSRKHRLEAMNIYHEPLVIFGDLQQGFNFPSTPQLSSALPDNIHILTLKTISMQDNVFGKYLFLQLEHIFQSDEHQQWSQSVDVDLETMFDFTSINVKSYKETTLGGNMWLEDLQRLSFNKDSNKIPSLDMKKEDPAPWTITMNAMDIRSFIIEYI